MSPPATLRHRLQIKLAVVILLAYLPLAGLYLASEWRGEGQRRDRDLLQVAGTIGAAFRGEGHTVETLDIADWIAAGIDTHEYELAILDVEDGRILLTTDSALPPMVSAEIRRTLSDGLITAEGETRIALRRVEKPEGDLLVVVSHGIDGDLFRRWLTQELAFELLPVLVAILAAALGAARWSVRHDLAPLARLSAIADAIRPGDRHTRLESARVPGEVLPLVTAINAALDRVDAAYLRQRRLSADAAHELRTPVAALQAMIDGLPPGVARTDLEQGVRRVGRLIGQLLDKARIEAQDNPQPPLVDLVPLTRDLLAELAPAALAMGRDLALIAPDVPVLWPVDPLAMTIALRNLVDNALGFSPVGGVVEIEIRPAGPEIHVRDQGPGIASQDLPRLFDPFWRAPGQGRAGAGLGLAIVAEVARQAGLRPCAVNRPNGGADFALLGSDTPEA